MIPRLVILLFAACLLSCGQQQANAQSKLAPQDFERHLKTTAEVQLVDVRTPAEYADGHLAGARNIDYYDDHFTSLIGQLDKDKPVMVYCAKGGRSASAAEKFHNAGFKDVLDLDGGIIAWKEAGMPVVKD
ncbi:MAG: rhodanese-like domain-containing protein [Saprospiraceae bacterium]|nr:rhodanese-like domain-containing protein [Saprospiraceae bacterium]